MTNTNLPALVARLVARLDELLHALRIEELVTAMPAVGDWQKGYNEAIDNVIEILPTLRQALSPVRESDKVQYLIWSGEHDCYWRPDASGYTRRISEAGRYTLEDAKKRTSHCGPEKRIEIEPIAALPPERGELEAALKPFAELKLPIGRENTLPDDTEVRLKFFKYGVVSSESYVKNFTVGDIRRARQALANTDQRQWRAMASLPTDGSLERAVGYWRYTYPDDKRPTEGVEEINWIADGWCDSEGPLNESYVMWSPFPAPDTQEGG